MAGTEKIAVGDVLPTLTRKGTVQHWMRFAAANDEFAPHHWDDDVAREEGFPAPFAMAPLEHAFFYALLRDWLAEGNRIVEVDIRLRSPFLKGRILTAGGTVASIKTTDGKTVVGIDLTATDDEGTTVATGRALIEKR